MSKTVESLSGLLNRLDAETDWQDFALDDVEAFISLADPVAEAVAEKPKPPARGDSPSKTLARLLWFGAHPEKGDFGYCLDKLSDPIVPIRIAAADALKQLFESTDNDSKGLKTSARTHRTLRTQLRQEPSPIVAHQLKELIELAKRSQREEPEEDLGHNPYMAGLPIRDETQFFGREDILREIRETLEGAPGVNRIILHGARRTGKTSLLYRIRDGAIGDAFVPVYVDLQLFAGVSVESLRRSLVMNVQEALYQEDGIDVAALPAPPDEIDFPFLRDYLGQAIDLLKPRRLLMLMDEYELLQQFFSDRNVAHQFQAMADREPGPLFVLAGSKKVEELHEKNIRFLLDASRPIPISFLSQEESRRLITVPVEGRLEFDDGVPERIHELSGGHPFYTQTFCQSLFELKEGRGRVDLGDVDTVAQKFVFNPSPHTILTWNTLSLDEQLVGGSLAELESDERRWVEADEIVDHFRREEHPIRLKRAAVRRSLANLRKLDWIEKQAPGRFRFTMEIVRRWVADSKTIWDLVADYEQHADRRLAPFKPQTLAWCVDLAALLVICIVAFLVRGQLTVAVEGPALLALFLLYFGVSLSLGDATPGMKLFKVCLLRDSGFPLRSGHSWLMALMLTLRGALWVLPLALTLAPWLAGEGANLLQVVLAWLILILTEALNGFMTARGERFQGLTAKLSRILAVRREAEPR